LFIDEDAMSVHSGKIAFITGGARGLGLETARQLGHVGIRVVLGVRDEEKGHAAAARLKEEGVQADSLAADINTDDGRRTVREELERRYGHLDILINNAGVMIDGTAHGENSTLAVAPEKLRETFDVNFFTPVLLTRELLPLLKAAPSGRIVNLSSILGSLTLHADPSSRIYTSKAFAYDASKTALNAFTVHLAQELSGTAIKVNSAHPGWVRTDMGGEGADLDIADGAKTSVLLATLPDDGPSGGFFHMGQPLPW
jgi:NAD(P)-dependent dehydrogenase (short-subunit alcohol dehydrogenase family)